MVRLQECVVFFISCCSSKVGAACTSSNRQGQILKSGLHGRGIPCEVWQTSVSFTGRYNMSFDVEFYFPVNQWLVGREDYHRMLKRVSNAL